MAVAGVLPAAELRDGISRSRTPAATPPAPVLGRLCAQTSKYDVNDDIIAATPPVRPWQELFGSVEGAVVGMLMTSGLRDV